METLRRNQLKQYLIGLWFDRNTARGPANVIYNSTETFKIDQDDAWLELSLLPSRQSRWHGDLKPNQIYYLRIHRYHRGVNLYATGKEYTRDMDKQQQADIIKELANQVSDEDVQKWFNWKYKKLDGTFRKLKPLTF